MKDDGFADSNVLLYTLDQASIKQQIVFALWRKGLVVSTQVVMEFTNVCLKKMKFSKQDAFENALIKYNGGNPSEAHNRKISPLRICYSCKVRVQPLG